VILHTKYTRRRLNDFNVHAVGEKVDLPLADRSHRLNYDWFR
jgi:hypothetical protein